MLTALSSFLVCEPGVPRRTLHPRLNNFVLSALETTTGSEYLLGMNGLVFMIPVKTQYLIEGLFEEGKV